MGNLKAGEFCECQAHHAKQMADGRTYCLHCSREMLGNPPFCHFCKRKHQLGDGFFKMQTHITITGHVLDNNGDPCASLDKEFWLCDNCGIEANNSVEIIHFAKKPAV